MKQQWTMMNLCRRRRELGNSNEIGDAKQQSAICSSVDAMAVMYVMSDAMDGWCRSGDWYTNGYVQTIKLFG